MYCASSPICSINIEISSSVEFRIVLSSNCRMDMSPSSYNDTSEALERSRHNTTSTCDAATAAKPQKNSKKTKNDEKMFSPLLLHLPQKQPAKETKKEKKKRKKRTKEQRKEHALLSYYHHACHPPLCARVQTCSLSNPIGSVFHYHPRPKTDSDTKRTTKFS